MKIKRVYHHYHTWEDYQNGMYKPSNDTELIERAKYILSTPSVFREAAKEVLYTWTIATTVNLTNNTCNKKAWVGQASCCYLYGVPEVLTRTAWGQLTDDQRRRANDVAESLINNWIYNYTHGKNQLAFDF